MEKYFIFERFSEKRVESLSGASLAAAAKWRSRPVLTKARGQAPEPTLDQTLTPRLKRSNKSTRSTQPMSADHQRHLPPRQENF